jgi:hypothetical protein
VRPGGPAISEFSGRLSHDSSDGYSLASGFLRLSVGGQQILFAADDPGEVIPDWLSAGETVLVLGGAWADDLEVDRRRDFASVICSRIEQTNEKEYADQELGVYQIPSPEIVDLSRVGRYHLDLRNSLSN